MVSVGIKRRTLFPKRISSPVETLPVENFYSGKGFTAVKHLPIGHVAHCIVKSDKISCQFFLKIRSFVSCLNQSSWRDCACTTSETSDVGSQYRCGRVGRGSQPPFKHRYIRRSPCEGNICVGQNCVNKM